MNLKPNLFRSSLLSLMLAFLPVTLLAVPVSHTTFQVTGAVTRTADWQPRTLSDQFRNSVQSIQYTRKGVKHTAHAVPLWTVLGAAQPKVNPQIKNHLLQFVVLVSGHDGYTAAFSMAELSPDFGNRPTWLALDEDGHALETPGQTDLIVPEDVKAGRWVHAVQRVTVVDEAQAPARTARAGNVH